MPVSHKSANDLYIALSNSVTPQSIKGTITVDLASVKCKISGKDAIGCQQQCKNDPIAP